jgi:hypothetical protein
MCYLPVRLQYSEPGPAISGQAAHEGRGAADRGEYRQAAGAITKALVVTSVAAPR